MWNRWHTVDAATGASRRRAAERLLNCENQPDIYALEKDHKRWIKDIATFRRARLHRDRC